MVKRDEVSLQREIVLLNDFVQQQTERWSIVCGELRNKRDTLRLRVTTLEQALLAAQADAVAVRENLRWILHLHHDIGKSGGRPSDNEWRTALDEGKALLKTPNPGAPLLAVVGAAQKVCMTHHDHDGCDHTCPAYSAEVALAKALAALHPEERQEGSG